VNRARTRTLRRNLAGIAFTAGAIATPTGAWTGHPLTAVIGALLLAGACIALINERRIDKAARDQGPQHWLDERHIHHNDGI